jgi:hypothetical protein
VVTDSRKGDLSAQRRGTWLPSETIVLPRSRTRSKKKLVREVRPRSYNMENVHDLASMVTHQLESSPRRSVDELVYCFGFGLIGDAPDQLSTVIRN